jgi:hypothetical protein
MRSLYVPRLASRGRRSTPESAAACLGSYVASMHQRERVGDPDRFLTQQTAPAELSRPQRRGEKAAAGAPLDPPVSQSGGGGSVPPGGRKLPGKTPTKKKRKTKPYGEMWRRLARGAR